MAQVRVVTVKTDGNKATELIEVETLKRTVIDIPHGETRQVFAEETSSFLSCKLILTGYTVDKTRMKEYGITWNGSGFKINSVGNIGDDINFTMNIYESGGWITVVATNTNWYDMKMGSSRIMFYREG